MSLPRYDDARFPLVVISIADDGMSVADIEEHARRLSAYARRAPFGMVIDLGRSPMPSAQERAALAKEIGALDATHPGRMRGSAIVVRSALHRGLMTAILWVVRPAQPLEPVSSVEEGIRWVERRLGLDDTESRRAP